MKKIAGILVCFLVALMQVNGQSQGNRTELLKLLDERKVLFDQYSETLKKKSGIFGSRTKNDIKESQQQLVAIVEADNRIISSLSRTIDYRNYEKQTMSYDVNKNEDRIRNLIVINDSLLSRLNKIEHDNKILRKKTSGAGIIIFAMVAFLILLLGYRRIFKK